MLIGIVFSLPLLAFTVYTVLTMYVDENGFVSPNSLFIKVGNNNMSSHNEMSNPTHEEIAHEAQDVLQVRPDFILKVPDYINKFLYSYQEQESSPTKSRQRVLQKLHLRGKRSTRLSNLEDEINSETNSTNLVTARKSTNSAEMLEIDFISSERNKGPDSNNISQTETDLIDLETINIDFVPNFQEPEKDTQPNDERNNITSSESNSTSPKITRVKINIVPQTNTDSGILHTGADPTLSEIGKKVANVVENSTQSEGERVSPGIDMIDPESPRRRNKREDLPQTSVSSPNENVTTTTPLPLSPTTTNNTTEPSSSLNNTITSLPPPPPATNNTKPAPPPTTDISTEKTKEPTAVTPETPPPKIGTLAPITNVSGSTTTRSPNNDNSSLSVIKNVTTDKSVTNEVTTSEAPTNVNSTSKTVLGTLSDFGKSTWSKIVQVLKSVFNFTTKPVWAVVDFLKSIFKKVTGKNDDELIEVAQTEFMETWGDAGTKVVSTISSSTKFGGRLKEMPILNSVEASDFPENISTFLDNNLVEMINPITSKQLPSTNNSNNQAEGPSQNLEIPIFSAKENQKEDDSLFDFEWPPSYYTSLLGLFYSCPLPANLTYTFYSIKGCPTCTSGEQDSELLITCASSFLLLEPPMKIMCSLGEWMIGKNKNVAKFPTCKEYRTYKKCPQLNLEKNSGRNSPTAECTQHGFLVDCLSQNIKWYPGTELEIVCPPHYQPSFGTRLESMKKVVGAKSTLCDDEGNWTKNRVSCKPECGLMGNPGEGTPLVMNGRQAPPGYLPWVVALFLKDGPSTEYICGGSLISNRALITAAHCVYTREPSELRVLVGNTKLNKTESLLYKVSDIKIPFSYNDKQGNYGSDIAILLMETPLEFNELVRPICVDWDNSVTVANMKGIGKVAGWGIDENFKEVLDLKFTDLPLVPVLECSKNAPLGFKKFFSYTNFCAGYNNGTGVCNGDSGSGFMLERDGLWYITGAVSISPRQVDSVYCESKSYSLYTKIELFIPWIKSIVTNSTIP